jgi:YVTN family beta-propeller protein
MFSSCEDDGSEGAYTDGIFITNEGAFGNSNGSISFYSYGSDAVTNNIFKTVNSRDLGDVVQSIKVSGDKAFIAVNASNKVEVVNSTTFEELATVEGVTGPRFVEVSGDKAYVSCWGDNTIKIIDLSTYSITKSIAVGAGPEKMVISDNKLYVANSGGWGTDSIISVIDLSTEEVVADIQVNYCPRDFAVDMDGLIWVLCYGKVVYDPTTYALLEETSSMLYRINPTINEIKTETKLFDSQHPTTLDINNDGTILFIGGGYGFEGIYNLPLEGPEPITTKIIDDYAYGFAYDESSEKLFVMTAPDFTSAGVMYRYSTDGTKLGTYSVGIGPNGTSLKNTK